MFVGIDVQVSRGCAYSVLNPDAEQIESGWIPVNSHLQSSFRSLARRFRAAEFGIDAPRTPRQDPRPWYWSAAGWRRRKASDRGYGRHCEVVVAALGLGRPQWTPLEGQSPEWMEVGYELFRILRSTNRVHEVFPSASYTCLEARPEIRLTLGFESFRPGAKDMLDAAVSALTVRELVCGSGLEVGGGDGLGTIVLPCPPSRMIPEVLSWPSAENECKR